MKVACAGGLGPPLLLKAFALVFSTCASMAAYSSRHSRAQDNGRDAFSQDYRKELSGFIVFHTEIEN